MMLDDFIKEFSKDKDIDDNNLYNSVDPDITNKEIPKASPIYISTKTIISYTF